MGIVFWLVSGAVSVIVARIIPPRFPLTWVDWVAATAASLALGATATALDFGGWSEPDWRAALFVFLGTFALAGARRALAFRKRG